MNPDKMEAGREMDALIAEKVMGMEPLGWKWFIPDTLGYESLYGWDEKPYNPRAVRERVFKRESNDDSYRALYYSSSIGVAWRVFEKFQKMGCPADKNACASIFYFGDTVLVCWSSNDNKHEPKASAATLPLAICRAALKAAISEGHK